MAAESHCMSRRVVAPAVSRGGACFSFARA